MSHPPVRLTRPTRPTVTGRWVLALWVLATLGICPLAHAGVTAVAEPANVPLERTAQEAPTGRETGSDADWAQLLRGLRAAAQAETLWVFCDATSGRPADIPPDVRDAFPVVGDEAEIAAAISAA